MPKDEAGKDGEEEDYSADEDFADDAGGVSEDGHVERDGGGVGGGGARGGMRSDVPRHMSLSKTLAQLREMDQEECTNWLRR